MKTELMIPTAMIVFNLLAAVGYLYAGDKMRTGYFVSGAFITYFACF